MDWDRFTEIMLGVAMAAVGLMAFTFAIVLIVALLGGPNILK